MSKTTLAGGCACGAIRYKLGAPPLIVHACHCHDCQRITGSAFVINLWIEREFVEAGVAPNSFRLTAGTGKPHEVFFCEKWALTSGVFTTRHPAMLCSFVPGHSSSRRRSNPTFTSSRAANCRGCDFRRTCPHSRRSTRSTKSGHQRAKNG